MYYYYFYHRIIPETEREMICEAIGGGDYQLFLRLREKWNAVGKDLGWGDNSFLPGDVFDPVSGKSIPLTEEMFQLIEYVEYENG